MTFAEERAERDEQWHRAFYAKFPQARPTGSGRQSRSLAHRTRSSVNSGVPVSWDRLQTLGERLGKIDWNAKLGGLLRSPQVIALGIQGFGALGLLGIKALKDWKPTVKPPKREPSSETQAQPEPTEYEKLDRIVKDEWG